VPADSQALGFTRVQKGVYYHTTLATSSR
jgi:hypothetical protein